MNTFEQDLAPGGAENRMKRHMGKQGDQFRAYRWNSGGDNSGSNQGGCEGHGRWPGTGPIWKVELTGLPDGWDVGERGTKDLEFGCLEERSCLFQNAQKQWREVRSGETRSLVLDL